MGILAGLKGMITGAGKMPDVVDTGLDLIKKGASGVDLMFYTAEEKAKAMSENAGAIIAHATKMNELMNQSNTASSRIRRTLAYWISGVVLGTFSWCVFLLSYAHFISGAVDQTKLFISDVVSVAESFYIGPAFTAVVVVFFGYYGLNKFMSNKKG